MPAIQFGGEGKQRGEWGVKRGENAVPFPGEEGHRGSGSAWGRWWRRCSVGLPEEEDGRPPNRWARLSVRGRRWGRLGWKGGGSEVGRGWAGNRKWVDNILSNFIWNLDFWQTLEICTRRF
jgi:hypothetical protein